MAAKTKKKSQRSQALNSLFQIIKLACSLLLLAFTYLSDIHGFILALTLLPIFYFSYGFYQLNPFATVLAYYRKWIKFQHIHAYFQQPPKDQQLPIKQFMSANNKRRKRRNRRKIVNTEMLTQLEKNLFQLPVFQSDIEEEDYIHDVYRPNEAAEKQINEKSYEKMYLATREDYKDSFRYLYGNVADRQLFERVAKNTKAYYTNRVSELLQMNENNLSDLRCLLEKYYMIRVEDGFGEEKSMNFLNISLDEAFSQAMEYQKRQYFTWVDKPNFQPNEIRRFFQRFQKLTQQRRQIDRFLSPYYPLNEKLRDEIVSRLSTQLEKPSMLGKELTYTVAEIFNERLKQKNIGQQYHLFKKDYASFPSLEIVETQIHNRFHVNLLVKRPEKQIKVICCPGENNLWTLIAFAVEVIEQRL